jgi:hypothetical protein
MEGEAVLSRCWCNESLMRPIPDKAEESRNRSLDFACPEFAEGLEMTNRNGYRHIPYRSGKYFFSGEAPENKLMQGPI